MTVSKRKKARGKKAIEKEKKKAREEIKARKQARKKNPTLGLLYF